MFRWKVREVAQINDPDPANSSLSWERSPSYGLSSLSLENDNGYRCFYLTHTSTNVSEEYKSSSKYSDTINNEYIRISPMNNSDIHSPVRYSIKLEYQSQSTHDNLKFLFDNAKEFYLYTSIDQLISNSGMYHLVIDELSVDWVARKGNEQIYQISLKCSDVLTESTKNPIKFRFEEVAGRGNWNGSYNNLSSFTQSGTTMRYFLSGFSPNSLSESFRKKASETESVNGNTVKIYPVRINQDNSISRIEPNRILNVKFEYQNQDFYDNLTQLYKTDGLFSMYDNSYRSGTSLGDFLIEDINIDYVAVRGQNRLYGINMQLKEANNVFLSTYTAIDPSIPPIGEIMIAGEPVFANGKWNYMVDLTGVSGGSYRFKTTDKIELVDANSGTLIEPRRLVSGAEVAARVGVFNVQVDPNAPSIDVQGHVIRNDDNLKMMMTNVLSVPDGDMTPPGITVEFLSGSTYDNAGGYWKYSVEANIYGDLFAPNDLLEVRRVSDNLLPSGGSVTYTGTASGTYTLNSVHVPELEEDQYVLRVTRGSNVWTSSPVLIETAGDPNPVPTVTPYTAGLQTFNLSRTDSTINFFVSPDDPAKDHLEYRLNESSWTTLSLTGTYGFILHGVPGSEYALEIAWASATSKRGPSSITSGTFMNAEYVYNLSGYFDNSSSVIFSFLAGRPSQSVTYLTEVIKDSDQSVLNDDLGAFTISGTQNENVNNMVMNTLSSITNGIRYSMKISIQGDATKTYTLPLYYKAPNVSNSPITMNLSAGDADGFGWRPVNVSWSGLNISAVSDPDWDFVGDISFYGSGQTDSGNISSYAGTVYAPSGNAVLNSAYPPGTVVSVEANITARRVDGYEIYLNYPPVTITIP